MKGEGWREEAESAEERLSLPGGLAGLRWGLGFLGRLVGFLWEKDWVDVGEDSSVGDGHTS